MNDFTEAVWRVRVKEVFDKLQSQRKEWLEVASSSKKISREAICAGTAGGLEIACSALDEMFFNATRNRLQK